MATDAQIELSGETLRYASRGGLKLEGALEDFGVTPENKVCLDAGSSTGGFTDCLLQHGAQKVYAVDVTIDQLDWKLRQDKRVVTIEKNARYLQPEDIGESVELRHDGCVLHLRHEGAPGDRSGCGATARIF